MEPNVAIIRRERTRAEREDEIRQGMRNHMRMFGVPEPDIAARIERNMAERLDRIERRNATWNLERAAQIPVPD